MLSGDNIEFIRKRNLDLLRCSSSSPNHIRIPNQSLPSAALPPSSTMSQSPIPLFLHRSPSPSVEQSRVTVTCNQLRVTLGDTRHPKSRFARTIHHHHQNSTFFCPLSLPLPTRYLTKAIATMDATSKVPVKLVKVTRVLGRTGLSSSPLRRRGIVGEIVC